MLEAEGNPGLGLPQHCKKMKEKPPFSRSETKAGFESVADQRKKKSGECG